MPEPANASVPGVELRGRHNLFLTPDGACDASRRSDARRDVELIWSAANRAGTPIEARSDDPSRHGNRLARRCRRGYPSAVSIARSAAALVIAVVAAALLEFALAQPDRRPPRAGQGARPATVEPAVIEPLDALRRPGVVEATKPRHAPTPRARSRVKPTPRAPDRRTAPRRRRTRARTSRPSPTAPPVAPPPSAPAPPPTPVAPPPSAPAPPPTPAPVPVAPRAPKLPAPVLSDAPPEFM
jgi:hypothetical protein